MLINMEGPMHGYRKGILFSTITYLSIEIEMYRTVHIIVPSNSNTFSVSCVVGQLTHYLSRNFRLICDQVVLLEITEKI